LRLYIKINPKKALYIINNTKQNKNVIITVSNLNKNKRKKIKHNKREIRLSAFTLRQAILLGRYNDSTYERSSYYYYSNRACNIGHISISHRYTRDSREYSVGDIYTYETQKNQQAESKKRSITTRNKKVREFYIFPNERYTWSNSLCH